MSPCRLSADRRPHGLPFAASCSSTFREVLTLRLHSLPTRLACSATAGGDEQNRTVDPLLARQVLSQLSYTPIFGGHLFGRVSSSTLKVPLHTKTAPAVPVPGGLQN